MATINAQSNELFQELKKLGWISDEKTLEEWDTIWKERPTFIAPEKKKYKTKKNKEPIQRCMARVWGNKDDPNVGTGLCQCTKSRNGNSEYCTQHAAQAAICVPINGYACENPWGLFHGRIDEHIPVADKKGRIVLGWNKGKIAQEIADNKTSGDYKNDGYLDHWIKTRKEMKIRKTVDYTDEKFQEFRRKVSEFIPIQKKPKGTKKKENVEESQSDSNTETSEAVKELEAELEQHTHAASETIDVQVDDLFADKPSKWHTFSHQGENYFIEEDTWLIYSQGAEDQEDQDGDKAKGTWTHPDQIYTKETFKVEHIKWKEDEEDDEDEDEDEDEDDSI